jgi:hypothetical protein
MMPFLIDKAAREIALTQWVLPDCLHVPIAAVDEAAITAYIGGKNTCAASRSRNSSAADRLRSGLPATETF